MGKLGREHLIDKVFSFFMRAQQSQRFVFLQLQPYGLGIKGNAVGKGNFITQGRGIHSLRMIGELIQNEKVQKDIIIRKAFRFPGRIEGIFGHCLTVDIDVDLFSLGRIGRAGLIAQPALDPPPFVVIGPGAAGVKIISHLKSINIKLAHIIPDPVKVFDKLLKFCHIDPSIG